VGIRPIASLSPCSKSLEGGCNRSSDLFWIAKCLPVFVIALGPEQVAASNVDELAENTQLPPAFRTLPSSTAETPSFLPIARCLRVCL